MKQFSDSFLNDYDILKNAIIGFEFEFYSTINYPMTLEKFNRELKDLGIKVWGFKQYHSDFEVDKNNFKIEPDFSGGWNLCELITGPMDYSTARIISCKIFKILQEIGYTQERSSLHINISFKNKKIINVNPLKLILNIEESKVYTHFPSRKNNIYTKSVKSIIPFKGYDFTTSTANILSNSLLLPQSKYYGINFTNLNKGRLEFRYIGGDDYEYKINEILNLLDYFILITNESINTNLSVDETKVLRKYLDDNIKEFKSLNKFDNFISKFPNIELKIDKQSEYTLVNSYYSKIYNKLFDIITKIGNIKNCIINYDTDTQKIEIVNGEDLIVNDLIEKVNFIDCEILKGDFSNCEFYGCDIKNAILNLCSLVKTNAFDSKLLECKVNSFSKIQDCHFSEGFLNGFMKAGVFRSGKIGTDAIISKETEVFNNKNNFFNLKSKNVNNTNSKKKSVYFTKKLK